MNKSWLRISGSCLCLLLVILLVGCGQSLATMCLAPSRSRAPIPKGTVLFQPDESKGCTGSAGIALIRDSKYDTAAGGTGVVGGPHLVRISSGRRKTIDSCLPTEFPCSRTTRQRLTAQGEFHARLRGVEGSKVDEAKVGSARQ